MAFSGNFSYAMEELGLAVIPGLISGIPSFTFHIAAYILTALALYAMAKRRGIRHAWLSWVPVVNCWVLGSLSDQYRYVVKGQEKSKRKVLLILNIITAVLSLLVLILAIVMAAEVAGGVIYGMDEDDLLEAVIGPVLGMIGLCLPMIGISIATMIIRYMALYDIYTSCDPGNNVLYLVLSILFNVTEPFFLFFNRNKDTGMPPRRPEPTWQPQEPVWQEEPVNPDYQ